MNALLNDALYYNGNGVGDMLALIHNKLSSYEYNYLLSMRESLKTLVSDFDKLYEEEQKQTSWLEKIWQSIQEFLGLEGESGEVLEEEPKDTAMVDLGNKEDSLLSGSNPDEASNNLVVDLDVTASASIWSIVDDLINCHPAVMTAFISILSLGIVALILGR